MLLVKVVIQVLGEEDGLYSSVKDGQWLRCLDSQVTVNPSGCQDKEESWYMELLYTLKDGGSNQAVLKTWMELQRGSDECFKVAGWCSIFGIVGKDQWQLRG